MKAEKPEDQDIQDAESIDLVDHISMSSFATASRHQFFEGAERGQILDVLPLLHLEDKNCVLIEAEQGYGKTSLAHQVYLQTIESDQYASMIHGSELGSGDDAVLVQALGAHLKIDSAVLSEVEDGVGLAGLYASKQDNRLVLVIDDAQQLSSMAVTLCFEFLSSLPKNRIQLVLFSLPKAPVLLADSALQDYLSEYGHQVCLRAFNSRETSEYVRFLLIASERDDVRLSRHALSRIFQMSAGVPSRVAEALVYALQDYDQQPQESEQVRSEVVPKWHLISLSLVAAGVLALILFGNPDQSNEQRFSDTLRSMPENPEAPTYQAPPIHFRDVKAPQPLQPSEAVNIADVEEPTGESIIVTPKPESIAKPKVSMDSKIAKLKAEREKKRSEEAAREAENQTIARRDSEVQPKQPSMSPTEVASWVKGMQPDHFTLQLLGGANKSAIRDFVKENGSLRKMGYFETKHDGRAWYVVVYGDFSSREQAVAAANSLPNQLRASKPWPRSAADIQSKMR